MTIPRIAGPRLAMAMACCGGSDSHAYKERTYPVNSGQHRSETIFNFVASDTDERRAQGFL